MSDTFVENNSGLESLNANQYSAADGSYVRIDNLDRHTAVTIGHELTKRLDADASTGRTYNSTNFPLSNNLAHADKKHLANEQVVFETNPAHGNYRVVAMLPTKEELDEKQIPKGRYSLIAEFARDNDLEIVGLKTTEELKKILQLGFTAMLHKNVFFPSKEEIDIERRLKDLGVPIPAFKSIEPEIELEAGSEIVVMEEMLANLGVRGIDQELLFTLCEIKNWNSVTVTDLFLHVVTQKQAKGHEYPGVLLKDLVQTADKLQSEKLRHEQEEQTFKIFQSIGFEESEIKKRYDARGDDESRKQAMRYVAWLASQEFMRPFSIEVSKRRNEGESVRTKDLFDLASYYVYKEYREHRKNKNELYDTSIDWQNDDYILRNEFLSTAMRLCFGLLYDQDISKILRRK